MKPILFAENSTVFTSNGIGRLADALDCVVTEERNGAYELEMTYPMSGQHYEDIAIRKIVVVKPSANANLQAFRIYKLGKPINGKVKVYAQHITYDLSKNVCMPFSTAASSSACNTVLQGLKTNAVETCPFTFWTDVTTVASYKQLVPASIRQRLGGIEGSVLDQFGGEYEWDNFTVKFHKNRGTERDITLRYGKNIVDIQQEENIASTVTGVVPYWINADGTDSRTLTEKAVYSQYASRYSTHLTAPLDLSQQWESKPTEAALRAAAQVYVNHTGFGLPKVSIDVSFVNLADTEEYKDILPLENVNLCDTIKVQFEKLGIDTTAEIVKTEYDVLKEKYISVEVGELKSNMASTIHDMDANTALAISNTGKTVFAQANTEAQNLVNTATAWLTSSGGYVMAVKNQDGSWKELLFLDNRDITLARNVLRINENGIGFSSNGVGGPYGQAWTLDGHLTIGGTNDAILTVYNDQLNIIFQAAENGVIWNAANSSMDANGKITANEATINGIMRSTETFTQQGTEHTRMIEVSSGSIIAKYDGTEIMSMKAKNARRTTIDTRELDIEGVFFASDGNSNIFVQSGVGIGASSDGDLSLESQDDDVNIFARNGSIYISAQDIYFSGNVHMP